MNDTSIILIILVFGLIVFTYLEMLADIEEPDDCKKEYIKSRILHHLQALCPDKYIVPIHYNVESLHGCRYSVTMTLGFSDMERHAESIRACFLVIENGEDMDIQFNSDDFKKYIAI